MKYDKNRVRVRIMKIFAFVLLIVLVIFIGITISKEIARKKEEVRIENIRKRYDEYRKEYRNLYHSHENDFSYIQKSIFSEPFSKDTSFTAHLKENQLTFVIEKDPLEGKKLKDKLLQDEEFIRCAKDILNTDITSISLSYTSHTYIENSFLLAFEIPDNESFIHIIYNTNNSNYHKKEKIAPNWYFVIRGKV